MKKHFIMVMTILLFLAGYLDAQTKQSWQPYIRFATDGGIPCTNNPAEANFLVPTAEGQNAGDHRFADGSNFFEYHFNLNQLKAFHDQHPLVLRAYLWNEYVVVVSPTPISSVNDGEIVAQYAPGPPWDTEATSGDNDTWIDVPLQQYYDLLQEDLYIAFFDGKTDDGWGPSVSEVGLWYLDDANTGTAETAVLTDEGTINIDGDISAWPAQTQWFSLENGAPGVLSTGDVTGLSASTAVGFDKENVYFAANVTDNSVSNSDSLIFYFGAYNISDSLSQFGHTQFTFDTTVTGLRKGSEPDYKFVVKNLDGTPTLSEENIIKGELPFSKVSVATTATGYTVQAQISRGDLFVPDIIQGSFKVDPEAYYPYAFEVVNGATGGSLLSGAANADENPSSWGLKTIILDKSTTAEPAPKGVVKTYTPGLDDADFVVAGYAGSGFDSDHRWVDGEDTLVYHFDMAKFQAMAPGLKLKIDFHVGNEYVIQTSETLDGEKTDVAMWSSKGEEVHDMSNEKDIAVDLESSGDLYVWFSDGIPTTGWGPSISKIRVYYEGVNKDSTLVSFVPGHDDQPYLVKDTGSGSDSEHRWADGETSFGYMFDLATLKAEAPEKTTLNFNVHIGNDWVIKVAKDTNSTPYEIARWSKTGQSVHDESNMAWQKFALQPYLDSSWTTIVFYFYDGTTSDGWGPSLRWDDGKPGVTITYTQLLAYYPFDSFIPGDPNSTESSYLVENPEGYTGSGYDDNHRWADNSSVIAYKFNKADLLAKDGNVDDIVFQVKVANEYMIYVNSELDTASTSQNLELLYDYNPNHNIMERNESNSEVKEVNLTKYFDMGWDDVYIMFRDGRPQDGWGPSLRDVTLNALKPALVSGVNKNEKDLPQSFALNQNYPNPFNPTTVISYEIPAASKVVLKIYNILGQEVKTLVNDVQAPGRYQIMWNGENNSGSKLASGVYLYRMIAGQQQIVKKMLLLK